MEPVFKVVFGESPVEGFGRLVVSVLKTADAVFHVSSFCEVVGRECFSLKDGEVDLDLVEPTRVDRKMVGDQVGEAFRSRTGEVGG